MALTEEIWKMISLVIKQVNKLIKISQILFCFKLPQERFKFLAPFPKKLCDSHKFSLY